MFLYLISYFFHQIQSFFNIKGIFQGHLKAKKNFNVKKNDQPGCQGLPLIQTNQDLANSN